VDAASIRSPQRRRRQCSLQFRFEGQYAFCLPCWTNVAPAPKAICELVMLSTSSFSPCDAVAGGMCSIPLQHMRRVLTPLKGPACPAAISPAHAVAELKAGRRCGTVVSLDASLRSSDAGEIIVSARALQPADLNRSLGGSLKSATANTANVKALRDSQSGPSLLRHVASFTGEESSTFAAELVPVCSAMLEPLHRPSRDRGSKQQTYQQEDVPASHGKKKRPTRAALNRELDALWFAVSLMAPHVPRDVLDEIRNRAPLDVFRWDAMVRYTCGEDTYTYDNDECDPTQADDDATAELPLLAPTSCGHAPSLAASNRHSVVRRVSFSGFQESNDAANGRSPSPTAPRRDVQAPEPQDADDAPIRFSSASREQAAPSTPSPQPAPRYVRGALHA
jgi:hypothetical protein